MNIWCVLRVGGDIVSCFYVMIYGDVENAVWRVFLCIG
jgi:hypothetical protein